MNKIIITGATSMIGAALVKAEVAHGTEVYAILRPNTNRQDRLINSPLVHPVYGTLEQLAEINGLPDGCDVFYHFAWAGTGKEERNEPGIQERNIRYTLDAVELAHRIGCGKFVGAGSQAEFGPVDGVIDEGTKCAPVLAYGMAKLAAGFLSRQLCEKNNMSHVWGRIFSVYGPHDSKEAMLKYAIGCWEQEKTACFSAATQLWNYLYESDAGEIFRRLGEPSVPSGLYCVASPISKPLREFIAILMRSYGEKAKAEFAPQTEVLPLGLNVNTEKLTRTLRYVPQVKFEEGIQKMIEYMQRDNRSVWYDSKDAVNQIPGGIYNRLD